MIKITDEAVEKIKSILAKNVGVFPRIVIKNGGCAGHIILLELSEKKILDEIVEISGIRFAISSDAFEYCDDISIYVAHDLTNSIIIKNNGAKKTCKCGKSFALK